MGNNILCCSTKEIVKYEEEKPQIPVIYSYPDEYVDDAVVHRSASEIIRLCLEHIQRNSCNSYNYYFRIQL